MVKLVLNLILVIKMTFIKDLIYVYTILIVNTGNNQIFYDI
jgi:hypothetical protein